MNRLWWQLPGPAQFVLTIAQDLQDGKNVLILLPRHMPRGISSAIRSSLNIHHEAAWYSLRPGKALPLDFLWSYFYNDLNRKALPTASLLANSENLQEKIIWLDGIESAEWGAWEEFLSDYGQACQHTMLGRPPIFCVPLIGVPASTSMLSEPFWSQYLWRGVVGSVDMLLFTSSMLQERSWSVLQKQVATAVISKLSLWDPEVCHRLATADLQDVLNPLALLKEVAAERKWSADPYRNSSWHEGMVDMVDKKWMTHSSILAVEASQKEIDRRIWNAELSILLPIVEEGRQVIIQQYRDSLRIPYQTNRHQTVSDLYDLEINHIRTQIKRGIATLDVQTQRLTHELTEIRNRLSHLKTVTPEMLDSDVLNDFIEQQWEQEIEELAHDIDINSVSR